ncbi:MAG: NAD(P)H-dependent oxidoreductase subunit E, partial [Spirochaetales bacterium]|nr:NAD(P)H-dependent oxidoreductase subunit E [Spirochaetales bacterium]
ALAPVVSVDGVIHSRVTEKELLSFIDALAQPKEVVV